MAWKGGGGGGLPLSHVARGDALRWDSPGTHHAREASKVELTANRGVGTAGVRDVVRVERHHVREHLGETDRVWGNRHAEGRNTGPPLRCQWDIWTRTNGRNHVLREFGSQSIRCGNNCVYLCVYTPQHCLSLQEKQGLINKPYSDSHQTTWIDND